MMRTCLWVLLAASLSVCHGNDRWVWSKSSPPKNSRIPGYVEPSTPSPPITTFRPQPQQPQGRGISSSAVNERTRQFKSITAHPFFLGPYPPFTFVPVGGPRGGPPPLSLNDDGTTKSRITADTAHDDSHGAVLDADDKYTTLDRLQSERGPLPPLPRPNPNQLGGLHPDEVFYADDDLLIIKGGGFHSDVFQDPPQTLDDGDRFETEPTRLRPVSTGSLHDQEYNGNVPAFLPPPPDHQRPLSLFVEGASNNNQIYVPYVFPSHQRGPVRHTSALQAAPTQPVATYVYPVPSVPFYLTPVREPLVAAPVSNVLPEFEEDFGGIVRPGHSLAGDTKVNFVNPRPSVNPDAEVFRRQITRPRL